MHGNLTLLTELTINIFMYNLHLGSMFLTKFEFIKLVFLNTYLYIFNNCLASWCYLMHHNLLSTQFFVIINEVDFNLLIRKAETNDRI